MRFESIWTFGHTYLAGGVTPRIRDFGLFPGFSESELCRRLYVDAKIPETAPYVQFSKHGMSIFLSTPASYGCSEPDSTSHRQGISRDSRHHRSAAAPLSKYGLEQFSYRFILDVLPYLILILVVGRVHISRWFKHAIIVGVIINLVGALTFHRPPHPKMYGHFMTEEPLLNLISMMP